MAAIALGAALLTGCSQSFKEINRPPDMSPVGAGIATTQPVAWSAYPAYQTPPQRGYSLWNKRGSGLYVSQRALEPGDLLTVLIEINDRASISNESDRSRTSGRSLGLNGKYDYEIVADELSVGAGNGNGSLGTTSSSDFAGSGSTKRSEVIRLSMSAVVTEVLPNGNLVIRGTQEVRVNAELRVLQVAGIVRPGDIGPNNTIDYDRIAEARISYGGRGRISEVQQPPWGQQVLDLITPL
ncbi:flagellar basal body L-ring protein FlgH [Notoacmeibacter ruber]|uniref:Flagellar L-ring protein n=1 Tax=Notoacmeibacter ruber TaxID=2670375 RepID=A0A3L7JM14_9HYPH|nr:flagellar basal body L-ring protein FlgH [Notoacmeibacter ruber]